MPPPGFKSRTDDGDERPAKKLPASRPAGFTSRSEPSERPKKARKPAEPGAPRPPAARTKSRPAGFKKRGGDDEQSLDRKPYDDYDPDDDGRPDPPARAGYNLDDSKWIKDEKESHSRHSPIGLGPVEVIMATPAAILVIGGDTTGENWIPRSQIYKHLSTLDRRTADVGDTGEVWVPQWLADRIPW